MTATAPQRRPLHERAADIARMLGPGWSLGAHPHEEKARVVKICGPEGLEIYVEVGTYGPAKGRISISGAYPYDSRGRSYAPLYPEPSPSITVAETRPVGEIAREITRRFLPAYRASYAQAQASKQATEEHERRECALIARLAPIVGATSARHTPNEADCSMPCGSATSMHVSLKASYDGNVNLHLRRIPEEAAARILTIIGEYRAG